MMPSSKGRPKVAFESVVFCLDALQIRDGKRGRSRPVERSCRSSRCHGDREAFLFSYLFPVHIVGLNLEPNSVFLSQSALRTLFKCTREVSLV